jgi:hypothetical protein
MYSGSLEEWAGCSRPTNHIFLYYVNRHSTNILLLVIMLMRAYIAREQYVPVGSMLF